jgi:hypothetical protein
LTRAISKEEESWKSAQILHKNLELFITFFLSKSGDIFVKVFPKNSPHYVAWVGL